MSKHIRWMAALAAVTMFSLAGTAETNAGWGHWGGGYGSYGSWGGYGGSYGSWGSHGGYGSYGGYGSHGSWGGWGLGNGGYYASSYGSYGSYGGYSSCGSSGGAYYSSPSYYQGPTMGTPAPAGNGDLPPLPDAASNTGDGTLHVNVPAGAKVYVNGRETTSTGAERKYVSRDLKSGYQYRYEVRAQVAVDGQMREQTRVVTMRAGESANLSFDMNDAPAVAEQNKADESVPTKLTLHVPADAKVFLVGQETSSQGPVRTFATNRLTAGQKWSDYAIKVTLNQDGRTLTKEQTLTLVGGEDRELTFNFGNEVASTASAVR